MRILLVNYEYPPLGGGGGIAHQDIAQALARRHTVAVLTTHFHGLPRREERGGVTIQRVPVWGRTELPTATIRSMVTFAPAAAIAGLKLARSFRPDVIHAFFAVPSGLPAAFLSRATGTPFVLTLVGADIFDPDPTAGIATHRNPIVRAVVGWVIRQAHALTAISQDTRRRAVEYHHAPKTTEVIPLGLVPPPPWLPTGEPSVPNTLVRFMTVGRLIPRKAHGDLLDAFARLRHHPIHLDIVGSGPLENVLRQRAHDLGLDNRVSFHGAVDDARKWQLLRVADCFVSASHYEGFGIVFLEAMSAGLPIVATDTGGHTDFLTTGEHALLVPREQPAQLAAALEWIIRDEGLRRRLGVCNREAVQRFLIDRTAEQYERLFERVYRTAQPAVPVPATALIPPAAPADAPKSS